MKKIIKKIDWIQIGVFSLGIIATVAKTLYENKRFNEELDKKYENNFEKKVSEIIDKKLSKIK